MRSIIPAYRVLDGELLLFLLLLSRFHLFTHVKDKDEEGEDAKHLLIL